MDRRWVPAQFAQRVLRRLEQKRSFVPPPPASLTHPIGAAGEADLFFSPTLAETAPGQGALECLEELDWIRPEAVRVRAGGRPTVRFRVNPWLLRRA